MYDTIFTGVFEISRILGATINSSAIMVSKFFASLVKLFIHPVVRTDLMQAFKAARGRSEFTSIDFNTPRGSFNLFSVVLQQSFQRGNALLSDSMSVFN